MRVHLAMFGSCRRYVSLMLQTIGIAAAVPPEPHDVTVDAKGVALRGCDPVSYQSGPNPGIRSRAFIASYQGAAYHVASAATRDTFAANPAMPRPLAVSAPWALPWSASSTVIPRCSVW